MGLLKYPELLDEPASEMTDLIEENLKVIGLANVLLKYLKIMRICQTIKRIITRNS